MGTAWLWSKRSTCDRLNVGAVFSRDGRILVTGYNGPPSGMPHCHHDSESGPCTDAEHAERNGIAFAARHGVVLECSELHVTHAPCKPCSMSVINAGIVRVTYDIPYRDRSGLELLNRAGVEVICRPRGSDMVNP